MNIRKLNWQTDLSDMCLCLVELQEAERAMDPRIPSGEAIANEYLAALKQDCTTYSGQIFVPVVDDQIGGYICIHCRYREEQLDSGPDEFGLISDLVVRAPWQGRGLAKALIGHAEDYARSQVVKWLRIGVLASNTPALNLYRQSGFQDYELVLEKTLD